MMKISESTSIVPDQLDPSPEIMYKKKLQPLRIVQTT